MTLYERALLIAMAKHLLAIGQTPLEQSRKDLELALAGIEREDRFKSEVRNGVPWPYCNPFNVDRAGNPYGMNRDTSQRQDGQPRPAGDEPPSSPPKPSSEDDPSSLRGRHAGGGGRGAG